MVGRLVQLNLFVGTESLVTDVESMKADKPFVDTLFLKDTIRHHHGALVNKLVGIHHKQSQEGILLYLMYVLCLFLLLNNVSSNAFHGAVPFYCWVNDSDFPSDSSL
jgi:hypothetical protein